MKFKSKMELAEALMAGRTFTCDNLTIFFDDQSMTFMYKNHIAKFAGQMEDSWNSYNRNVWTEIKPWYDQIPERGVLCKMQDRNGQYLVTTIVVAYRKSEAFSFMDEANRYWFHATPLTDEEIDAFKIGYKKE